MLIKADAVAIAVDARGEEFGERMIAVGVDFGRDARGIGLQPNPFHGELSRPFLSFKRNHRAAPRVAGVSKGDMVMDKEHIKGAADKVKGSIKEAAGKVTGDASLEAEGKIDKAKGAAHNALGDAKDAVKRATR